MYAVLSDRPIPWGTPILRSLLAGRLVYMRFSVHMHAGRTRNVYRPAFRLPSLSLLKNIRSLAIVARDPSGIKVLTKCTCIYIDQ